MPTDPTSEPLPLPPPLRERVRTYLAAFLPAEDLDDAVDEVASDAGYWGDGDDVAVLGAAHTVLGSRLRIAPEAEVLVLADEVGCDVATAARVLGRPGDEVAALLDRARAELGTGATATTAPTADGGGPDAPDAVPGSPDAAPPAPTGSAAPDPDGTRDRVVVPPPAGGAPAPVPRDGGVTPGEPPDRSAPPVRSILIGAAILTGLVLVALLLSAGG